jgi:Zn-dependent M28 family amino/carboxypeptidase
LALLFGASCTAAEELRFPTLNRELVESRVKRVSYGNEQRSQVLQRLFEESGCRGAQIQIQVVKQSKLGNVICTITGSTDSVIIVGAHFDHVELGQGAVDNWSGAALLSSLFQTVALEQRKHTFIFVGFTDEEKGLVGSRFYAGNMSSQQRQKVKAMVNLECLGLSNTGLWLSQADARLAVMLKYVADALGLPLTATNVEQVGSSDSVSFSKKKIPSLTVHSVTQETFKVLHSPQDKLAAINMLYYYDTYRLLAAYLVYLDSKLD